MPAPGTNKDYVLGSGQIFFDLFLPNTNTGTGERYLGNSPELSTSREDEVLDHYDADEGLRVKDDSVTLERNQTLTFNTDHISLENVAAFFGGDLEKLTITAETGAIQVVTVIRGRNYQLGVTDDLPQGARNITITTVTKPGTPDPVAVSATGNFELNSALGRVYIEPDAPDIEDGDVLTFTFDIAAGLREFVIGKGMELVGAMRFIATNPKGTKKDYYWPKVKLSPNGDYALKGQEWQVIPFTAEVLKRDATTEPVYIDARA